MAGFCYEVRPCAAFFVCMSSRIPFRHRLLYCIRRPRNKCGVTVKGLGDSRSPVKQKNPELVRVGILVELEYEILASQMRAACAHLAVEDYIMPPMPMDGSIAGAAGAFGSFFSVITQSVVRIIEAMEAAFLRAVRVTLAGSITPALMRSS